MTWEFGSFLLVGDRRWVCLEGQMRLAVTLCGRAAGCSTPALGRR
jgi:hypothetical protein